VSRPGFVNDLTGSTTKGGDVQAGDLAYNALAERIIDGTYVPGTRLGEVELAEGLGISRTPIREAVRRLEARGLVETLPNRGARVRVWTPEQVVDILELRALLEGRAARRAASKATPDDIATLSGLCDLMESAERRPGGPDIKAIADLNGRFHEHVVKSADSPMMVEMTQSLSMIALVARTFGRYGNHRLRQSMQQHRDIVAAVASGDGNLAEALMRSHILSATTDVVDSLGNDGDSGTATV
jgi:DNA-binding GntR family transcriptional regulator